jgi:hypothetical protein
MAMETSPHSKKGLISGTQQANSDALFPVATNKSKEAEASSHPHNQRSIMATIADDDDRLLVRIGYTPVRYWFSKSLCSKIVNEISGLATPFFEMVDRVVCHLDSRSPRISPSDFWQPDGRRRTCNCRVGMVHWQCHGILHSELRYALLTLSRV